MKKPSKYTPILSRQILYSISDGNKILEKELKGKSLNKKSMEKIIRSFKSKLGSMRKKGTEKLQPWELENYKYKMGVLEIAIYLAEIKHNLYLEKYESYENEN